MKAALLTREYPPGVYGGAGVHVDYLSRELARVMDVEVRCFGGPRERPEGHGPVVRSFQAWEGLSGRMPHASVLRAMSVDLAMVEDLGGIDLVHSHTWYANLAGHLARLLYGVPHVATTHSLEPLRPWKAEQLGKGGYEVSAFCERTGLEGADAVIAVSREMRRDVLRSYPAIDPGRVVVIHNGIDLDEYRPDDRTDALRRYGIDPRIPSVVFVGRVTRQKGLTYLLDAALHIDPSAQLVLCAGAPDTEEIARDISTKVKGLEEARGNVSWIESMLPKEDVIQVLSHATVFCCPSIYEPLGIVNLEAMACATAVVATATGGIPEVVEDEVTGFLVPFEPADEISREPRDPDRFVRDLAARVNALLA
ncbi:MAG: glycogen synthase, partial [Actinomycetota bacterium]